jgi:Iron-sulfur cluster assembly protein
LPAALDVAAAAVTPAQVTEALRSVLDPELSLSVVELGLIYGIAIDGPTVRITASTAVRVLGELGAAMAGARGSSLAALGGFGQLAAAIVFVVNMWTRVRMPGGVAPPHPPR